MMRLASRPKNGSRRIAATSTDTTTSGCLSNDSATHGLATLPGASVASPQPRHNIVAQCHVAMTRS